MKTKKEVHEFLDSLQWERVSKKDLKNILSNFFGKEMDLEDSTDADGDLDYALVSTTGDSDSTNGFIDIEIYYLNMRNGKILITGTELLDYVD